MATLLAAQEALALDTLNPAQKQAVLTSQGPLLVLAGAGSGKTRVLTFKIAELIRRNVHPSEILSVTFTNKAAKEMQARVASLVGPDEAKGLWLGTFHSVAARLLRSSIHHYQPASGRTWNNQFVIYDEVDSMAVMKEAVKLCQLDDKLYNPKIIRHQISGFKNNLISAETFAQQANDYRKEKIAQLYQAYETLLCRNNALDFDDLLLKTVELLQQNPQVLQRLHQQFRHILVDEFQDTNDSQYELIRLIVEGQARQGNIAPPNQNHPQRWQNRSFTVVGDVDQSIYSWRGANFKILLNFQQDFPEAELIKLEENYRSTGTILELANAVIQNNSERIDKVLKATRGQGSAVHCYEASDDRDEAYFVVEQFQKLIREKDLKPGDCCILYRTNAQSRSLEDVLISQGISYTIVGGIKFYERKEIKDMLAYMTVIFNPQDGYSLKRIINAPKRGIGKTTLDKIEAHANVMNWSLHEALQNLHNIDSSISPKTQQTIVGFLALIDRFRAAVEAGTTLDQLVIVLLDETGYVEALRLEDPTDEEGRLENLDELVNVVKSYLLDNPNGDLAGFLTQMALLSDLDNSESKENQFVLMTVHAAKGLEYPAVALVGLEEGVFPHSRSLNEKAQMEEERRLMYVAITRAEDKLLLSYARKRMVYGDLRFSTPSRFLKEMPQHLLSGSYSFDSESDHYSFPDTERYAQGRVAGRSAERQSYQSGGQRGGGGYTRSGSGYDYDSRDAYSPRTVPLPPGGLSRQATSKPSILSEPMPPVTLLAKGSRVSHAKFGQGTIEQIIGEGHKAIYSVAFDTVPGKKLLDPKIAQLTPID